jgi:rfaE bifunctional protein kinase chain/domain
MLDKIRVELESVVENWRGKSVVVLGDMILDEFIYGVTDRVSREAPVVIVRYDSSAYVPGGAANAVRNLSSLGGSGVPVGFVGGDDPGRTLLGILREDGTKTDGLHIFEERLTTNKIRVMAGDHHAQRQQMVRIDKEQRRPISGDEEKRIISNFERELPSAEAVILSDYGQGLFTERVIARAIRSCRDAGVPVIADSRFMLTSFKGVTAATPNEVEAAAAAGVPPVEDAELERMGRKLLKRLSSDSLLVTRGKFGMSLFERRRKTKSIAVIGSSEATDVTGAGDTVVSVVALTLAAGGTMEMAMHLANVAASIVVMKRGTAVATVPELLDVIGKLGRR